MKSNGSHCVACRAAERLLLRLDYLRLDRLIVGLSGSQQVDYSHQNGGNNNPEQLEPVEKRDANELWQVAVVERGPQQGDERDE